MSPALPIFPTLISSADRFDALVDEAGVRLSSHQFFPGNAVGERHFVPEVLGEPRSVPVRLLRPADLFDELPEVLDDVCVKARLAERRCKTLSLHAFLAFLGQHREACKFASGTTVFDGPSIGGYACVYRYIDRPGFKRDLLAYPIRSSTGKSVSAFIWAELFAVEPVSGNR